MKFAQYFIDGDIITILNKHLKLPNVAERFIMVSLLALVIIQCIQSKSVIQITVF